MSLQCLKRHNFFNNEVETITKERTEKRRVPDPFKYLDNLINEFNAPTIKGLPNFLGGLIGYFSYESFNFIEPKLNLHSPDIPFISICECNEIIVFDNFKGTFYIIVTTEQKTDDGYQSAKRRIKEIKSAIYSLQPSISQNINRVDKELISTTNPDEKTFKSYVKNIKSLINDGEIMQAVLSREVSFKGNFNPFTLYRALRLINPSPYMFYMNFGDLNLIGSSPEILVQNFQDKVTIRPIAGTRKRGIDESEDLQNKIDLIGDDKEGDFILNQLKNMKITNELIIDNQAQTITKIRIVSRNMQLIRTDFEDEFNPYILESLLNKFKSLIKKSDFVIFSDYGKGALFRIGELINICNKNNVQSLVDPKQKDFDIDIANMKVDGGASNNNFLMQFQSDILNINITRPKNIETTALGAAILAGLKLKIWKDKDDLLEQYNIDKIFKPDIDSIIRSKYIKGWKKAIQKTKEKET